MFFKRYLNALLVIALVFHVTLYPCSCNAKVKTYGVR